MTRCLELRIARKATALLYDPIKSLAYVYGLMWPMN